MIPLPTSKEDLTPEWFTSILRLAKDSHVESVDLRPLGEQDSVSGYIYRARLSYRNKTQGTPESVVVKLPQPRNLRTPWLLEAYRNEVMFYRSIAPTVGIPVPCHIYSDIEAETGDYVLVIEDFPDSTNVRDKTGATLEQAYILIENIARLHAGHWQDPKLLEYNWLESPNEDRINLFASQITKCLPLFLSRFSQYIQSDEMEVFKALPKHYGVVVKPLWFRAPLTLIHNDFSMKNILILDRPSFVLVDWAMVGRGPGVRDLSFFIQTSIPPVIRSEYEIAFLEHYWSRLRYEGVSDYSFERMFDDYRRSVIIDMARTVAFGGREFFRSMYKAITIQNLCGRTGSARELNLISLFET